MNGHMHAVEITSFGAPDVLRLGERPVPQAGTGELLIRVSASGINRPDVLQRLGHYARRRARRTCPDWRSRASLRRAMQLRWRRRVSVLATVSVHWWQAAAMRSGA